MTRWLDDAEKRTWRLYLYATRMVEAALDAQLRRDAGMPHSYYEVLVFLSAAADNRMRMGPLAAATMTSRSRLSHAVGRLEALGWVVREADEEDGRGTVAVLTDDGRAALVAAAPGHVEEVRRRIFDPLEPQQQHALAEACAAILRALGHDPDEIAARLD